MPRLKKTVKRRVAQTSEAEPKKRKTTTNGTTTESATSDLEEFETTTTVQTTIRTTTAKRSLKHPTMEPVEDPDYDDDDDDDEEEEEEEGDESKKSQKCYKYAVGTAVLKFFPHDGGGGAYYEGRIVDRGEDEDSKTEMYKIRYEDEDEEILSLSKLMDRIVENYARRQRGEVLSTTAFDYKYTLGTPVLKYFPGNSKPFEGRIVTRGEHPETEEEMYGIRYEDNDYEVLPLNVALDQIVENYKNRDNNSKLPAPTSSSQTNTRKPKKRGRPPKSASSAVPPTTTTTATASSQPPSGRPKRSTVAKTLAPKQTRQSPSPPPAPRSSSPPTPRKPAASAAQKPKAVRSTKVIGDGCFKYNLGIPVLKYFTCSDSYFEGRIVDRGENPKTGVEVYKVRYEDNDVEICSLNEEFDQIVDDYQRRSRGEMPTGHQVHDKDEEYEYGAEETKQPDGDGELDGLDDDDLGDGEENDNVDENNEQQGYEEQGDKLEPLDDEELGDDEEEQGDADAQGNKEQDVDVERGDASNQDDEEEDSDLDDEEECDDDNGQLNGSIKGNQSVNRMGKLLKPVTTHTI